MRWNLRAQLLEYTDCSGKSTHYAYDEHSLLASVTDAMGNATVYRNDAAGRVMAIIDPEGGVQQLHYDELGRLSAVIDPAEHRTSYERNARAACRPGASMRWAVAWNSCTTAHSVW